MRSLHSIRYGERRYPNKKTLCRALGIAYATFCRATTQGRSTQEAVEYCLRIKRRKQALTDAGFSSAREFVASRLQEHGDWRSTTEIIQAEPVLQEMNRYSITHVLKALYEQGIVERKRTPSGYLFRHSGDNTQEPCTEYSAPKPVGRTLCRIHDPARQLLLQHPWSWRPGMSLGRGRL